MITNWPFLLPGVLPSVADIVCCAGLSTWGNSSSSQKEGMSIPYQGGKMDQNAILEERREELLKEAKMTDGQRQLFLYKELWAVEEALSRID